MNLLPNLNVAEDMIAILRNGLWFLRNRAVSQVKPIDPVRDNGYQNGINVEAFEIIRLIDIVFEHADKQGAKSGT